MPRLRSAVFIAGLMVALGAGALSAADKFSSYQLALNAPMTGGFAITKSDATVFSQPTRAVWVGGVGDLAVTYLDGTTDTLKAVPTGTMLNIRVTQVLATGTTATNISGLY